MGGASGHGQAEPVVIDLTLSSDEEDDPPLRHIPLSGKYTLQFNIGDFTW